VCAPPGRPRLAVRAVRPRRRTAAVALRAAGVAVPEPALHTGAEPDAPGVPPPREPVSPDRRRAGLRGVPVRPNHLPPDRAPHGGRDVAHGPVPGRAAAGAVLRGVAPARR